MIRTSLLAMGAGGGVGEAGNVGGNSGGDGCNTEVTASAVPEELFRKYTETDSRPLTPTPTLASGPTALTNRAIQEDLPAPCNPRERTTLVLDLRTNSQNQQVVGIRPIVSLGKPLSSCYCCPFSFGFLFTSRLIDLLYAHKNKIPCKGKAEQNT